MSITKRRVPASQPAGEAFIQGAPDGKHATPDDDKGVQITLRMQKAQLEKVTAVAKRQGIPRASYIKRAIAIQLETDEK